MERKPRASRLLLRAGGKPIFRAKSGPRASNVCEVAQTRFCEGLMFEKKRRMRSPFVGRVGKESKCGKSFRAWRRAGRPRSSRGRKLAKSSFHFPAYGGR